MKSRKIVILLSLMLAFTGIFNIPKTYAVDILPNTFCATINTVSSRIEQSLETRQKLFTAKKESRLTSLKSEWANIDLKRQKNRDTMDNKRDQTLKSLSAKAATQEEKDAVAVFISAITEATAIHRLDIDKAVVEYRDGVINLLSGKNGPADTLVSTLKASFDTAIEKAKKDCSSDTTNQKAIKDELKASLKNAKDTLKSESTTIAANPQVQTLVNVRAQKIEQADTTFQASIEKAKAALLEAFPKK